MSNKLNKQNNASISTRKINESFYNILDFNDKREIEFAKKGLLAAPESLEIKDDKGNIVWSQKAYEFLENEETSCCVNPSLWRNSALNHIYGLFEVVKDKIYQVRGYDMTNMTFIVGNTGWIIFDPLMSVECCQAAMKLVEENLGKKPIKAVVISHPHVDHFGGIKGIVTEEQIRSGEIPLIVPEHFEHFAVSENIYSGVAMTRRAQYQYGPLLEKSEKGSVGIGIGQTQSAGTITYISPNDIIKKTGDIRKIDGITMEFQMTPGTEAPAEMNTWFPDFNALWMAENCTGTLHNIYTLRGAQVRDASAWASYLLESLSRYGDNVEVVFQAHNWPHWGNNEIHEYIINTATIYKFIHDQTLLYANQGYTGSEISNMIKLPSKLEKNWYTRQYYGTLKHNSRAVYQKYLGWYDGNPTNLNKLSPSDRGKKYLEYFEDINLILDKAEEDYAKGEYQWVAEITNQIVFADPENERARNLCADSFEQLAYQSENGTWRNAYLMGAKELRYGVSYSEELLNQNSKGTIDILKNITIDMALDYWAIMIDSNAAQELNVAFNLIFEEGTTYFVNIVSGVLLYQPDIKKEKVDSNIYLKQSQFISLVFGDLEVISTLKTDGRQDIFNIINNFRTDFDLFFNIIEPKK